MSSTSGPASGRRRRNLGVEDRPLEPLKNAVFCIGCYTTPKPSDPNAPQLFKLDCGHHHCSRCLTLNFAARVKSKPFRPARCCPAAHPIDPEILKAGADSIVVEDFMDRYLALFDEYTCKDKLYCHVKACSTFIPTDQRTQRTGSCPKCHLRTCKRCKARSHFSACAAGALEQAKGDTQLLALASQQNWKQCPKCSIVVERVAGCWHMTCVCGCEFCYMCGQTPFGDHQCVNGTVAVVEEQEDEEEDEDQEEENEEEDEDQEEENEED